jgi:hypothetical protein
MTQRTVTQDRFTILGAVPLLLLLLLSGCTAPKVHVVQVGTVPPMPTPLPTPPLDFVWNTTRNFGGFKAVHLHVAVADASHCNVDFKASFKLPHWSGPRAYLEIDTDGGHGFSGVRYSSAGVFRVHAAGVDSQSIASVPNPVPDGDSTLFAVNFNTTIRGGFDAYAVGNLTPVPDPHQAPFNWFSKSLVLSYSCDHPAQVQGVSVGDSPVLLDPRNERGGIGANVGLPVVGGPALGNDTTTLHLAASNVTVIADLFAGPHSATTLEVRSPHAGRQLAATPLTSPFGHAWLYDSPGDYTVSVTDFDAQGFADFTVALIGTEPVAGLQALAAP